VSDPSARAGNGPARVRRVAHAMAVGVLSSSYGRLSAVSESPRISSTCGHGMERRSSGQSGSVRAGNPGPRTALVPHAMTKPDAACVACDRRSFRGARRVNNHGHIGCAGHHAIDARSVLGTVQGSSLRSTRACARPAGLDGACAQIASWLLRDGWQCDGLSWTDLDL
jgi:hypothetical protein